MALPMQDFILITKMTLIFVCGDSRHWEAFEVSIIELITSTCCNRASLPGYPGKSCWCYQLGTCNQVSCRWDDPKWEKFLPKLKTFLILKVQWSCHPHVAYSAKSASCVHLMLPSGGNRFRNAQFTKIWQRRLQFPLLLSHEMLLTNFNNKLNWFLWYSNYFTPYQCSICNISEAQKISYVMWGRKHGQGNQRVAVLGFSLCHLYWTPEACHRPARNPWARSIGLLHSCYQPGTQN